MHDRITQTQTARDDGQADRRRLAACVSVAMVALTLAPIAQNFADVPEDGFPLSYYPMFTAPRDGSVWVTHPVGVLADGSVIDLDYRVAGSGGMNQVRRQITRSVREGRADELTGQIRSAFAARWGDTYPGVREVGLVRDRFEFAAYFAGDRTPTERRWVARIAVDAAPGGA